MLYKCTFDMKTTLFIFRFSCFEKINTIINKSFFYSGNSPSNAIALMLYSIPSTEVSRKFNKYIYSQ